jgi:diguanylate cyclase (GGDEF)-like protein
MARPGFSLHALLMFVFVFVLSLSAVAAPPDATAVQWTGLSDTLFTHLTAPEAGAGTSIAQDGDGFLWIGTEGGLARWDGYRLRRYTGDPEKSGALPDSFILALHIDDRGRLWVGTNAGGLARYDAQSDKFVVIAAAATLGGASVSAIADDGTGGLWIGTGAGLDHVDAQQAVLRGGTGGTRTDGLPEGGVRALLNDRTGALWVGTQQGLWRRERAASKFSAMPLGATDALTSVVTALYQDSADRVWVGTNSHGAFVVEGGDARAVHEGGALPTLQSDSVTSIVEVAPGDIWLGTFGGGIVDVDTKSGFTQRIRHSPDTPTSLRDNDVWALYRDHSGLVWVATDQVTSQHDPHQTAVATVLGATGRPNGISRTNVYYVLPVSDGRIWLSVGDGIDIIDPVLGRVGQLRPDPAHPDSALPKGRIQAMVAGDNGDVYIGTQQGLYRSNSRRGNVLLLKVPGRSPTGAVTALCFDAGVLWIGGMLDGLWAVDVHSTNKLALLSHEAGTRLGDARVTSIERGRGAELWVGTRGGLAHVDATSDSIERVPANATDPTQFPGGYVSSILVDRRGRLWVSSFGAGVQVLERRDANGHWHFRRLGLRDGLPHLGVDKLLEDARGNVWAGTDNGLALIDGTSFAIRTLQGPQGVGMQSFWMNSGAVTATGELLFGGTGGLAVVSPEHDRRWNYRPPVVVTEVRTGTIALPVGRFNQMQDLSSPLEISPRNRDLSVEFAALDYSAPERNRYAYRLQGFDTDWIATNTTRRLASYTNLPPGNYTLQLRGSNRDGEWSQPLQIPVLVVWFRVMFALLALALVIALMQIRTAYLRRLQRELEALVAERTAELELRSEQLRDSKRLLEEIAYNDPLTGLPNRRLFEDELRHRVALARRDGGYFTLLLIDLDGFKKFNDTLGHAAGDALLMAMALRLNGAVREADRVARMGGDEFAVVLTQTRELAAVELVCRRIMSSLSEPVSFNGATMQVTASIGSVQCPTQGTAADELYKAADIALYDAKHRGRNTWCWYGQINSEQRLQTVVTDNEGRPL